MTRRRALLGAAVLAVLLAGAAWVAMSRPRVEAPRPASATAVATPPPVRGNTQPAVATPPTVISPPLARGVTSVQLQAVAAVALVVAALSLLVAVLLYRGRRALLRAPTYLWPEDHALLLEGVARANRQVETALNDLIDNQAKSAGELGQGMTQLRSAFVTMHNALDQREKEIATLRAGYETIVVKRIARRLLGVAQLLERRSGDRDAEQTITSAARLMEDLLEELGVTRFEPPLGAKYPSVSGVEDSPDEQPTNLPEADLTVSEVVQPGYRIEQADKSSTVLKLARVRIYRYAETGT